MRCTVLQNITVQTVAAATFANMGTQLALSSHPALATACGLGTAVGAFLISKNYRRIQRIDKFERNIKGGAQR